MELPRPLIIGAVLAAAAAVLSVLVRMVLKRRTSGFAASVDIYNDPGQYIKTQFTETVSHDVGIEKDIPPLIDFEPSEREKYSSDRLTHEGLTRLSYNRNVVKHIDDHYTPGFEVSADACECVEDDIRNSLFMTDGLKMGASKTGRKTKISDGYSPNLAGVRGSFRDVVMGQDYVDQKYAVKDQMAMFGGEGTANGVHVGDHSCSNRGLGGHTALLSTKLYEADERHGFVDTTEERLFEHGELADSTRNTFYGSKGVYDTGVTDAIADIHDKFKPIIGEFQRPVPVETVKSSEFDLGIDPMQLYTKMPSAYNRQADILPVPHGEFRMTKSLKGSPHSHDTHGDPAPVTHVVEQTSVMPGIAHNVAMSKYDDFGNINQLYVI